MKSDPGRNPEEWVHRGPIIADAPLSPWPSTLRGRWRCAGESLTWGLDGSPPNRISLAGTLAILLRPKRFPPLADSSIYGIPVWPARVRIESHWKALYHRLYHRFFQAALSHSADVRPTTQHRASRLDQPSVAHACWMNACSGCRLSVAAPQSLRSPSLRGMAKASVLSSQTLYAPAQRALRERLGTARNTNRLPSTTALRLDTLANGPGLIQRHALHEQPRPMLHDIGIRTASGEEMTADNNFTGYRLLRRRCSSSPATSSLVSYPCPSRQPLPTFQGTMA
jgi:hypothetical protein